MNAECDRFLPFDENVIDSNIQNILTEENLYSKVKSVYHNPIYNNKYCSADGLEGLYGNKFTRLSLFRGNAYYDNLIKKGIENTDMIRIEVNHDKSCINNLYDACMQHGPTFNYCQGDNIGHYYFDMIPYFWWGNCP